MSVSEIESKVFRTLEDAVAWRERMRKKGKTVSLTNGCFDILHRGHAEYLMSARALGDSLIVLMNSDASVRALKGPTRPVNTEGNRAFLLACLSFVDAVLVFDSQRCDREIAAIRPDAYAKGGDYTIEKLDKDERAALFASGTKISFIPFVDGLSSSSIIAKSNSK